MEKRLYSIDEIAVYLGLKEGTIYHWVSDGKIRFVKMGRLVKFDKKDIDDLIDQSKRGVKT